MEDNKQVKNKIELKPEVAEGVYANLAVIAHSPTEFVVDFLRMMPGLPYPTVKSRIILAPEHAKRLMLALQENVGRYEQLFGTISLHDVEAAPVAFGEGKADA